MLKKGIYRDNRGTRKEEIYKSRSANLGESLRNFIVHSKIQRNYICVFVIKLLITI